MQSTHLFHFNGKKMEMSCCMCKITSNSKTVFIPFEFIHIFTISMSVIGVAHHESRHTHQQCVKRTSNFRLATLSKTKNLNLITVILNWTMNLRCVYTICTIEMLSLHAECEWTGLGANKNRLANFLGSTSLKY